MKLYEQSHSNSPEDEMISLEDRAEIIQKVIDRGEWFKRVFFEDSELEIWTDRSYMSVRALAIKHHQSRFNIRKKIAIAEKKINKIKELFRL